VLLDVEGWLELNAVTISRREERDGGGLRFESRGEELSVPGFGGTSCVRDLLMLPPPAGWFPLGGCDGFGRMIDALRGRGVRCYGAPYDFRRVLDADVAARYAADFRSLVERATDEHGARAVVVTHSLGACVMGGLAVDRLRERDRAWLRERVAAVVDVFPACAGSDAAVRSMRDGGYYRPLSAAGSEMVAAAARGQAGLIMTLPNPLGGPVAPGAYDELVGDAWRTLVLPLVPSLAAPYPCEHVAFVGTGHATLMADGSRVDGDSTLECGATKRAAAAAGARVEVIRCRHRCGVSHDAVVERVAGLALLALRKKNG
jgi:hypothetical protein